MRSRSAIGTIAAMACVPRTTKVREWLRSAASTASRQWLGKSASGMPYLLGTG